MYVATGLVPPAAALAVLGKGGGALIAVIVLMAITSSGSAEMVAVSSLLTYDIYKVFWNKKATGLHLHHWFFVYCMTCSTCTALLHRDIIL